MARTRIISGLVGLVLLIGVLYMGSIVLGIAVSIIAAIGLYEFYNSISKTKGIHPIKIVGYLSIVPLLLLGLEKTGWYSLDLGTMTGMSVCLIIFVSMAVIVFGHKKYNIVDVCATAFGIAYIPFLMSFLIMLRNMEYGNILIWLIFIGAWGTDTLAYTFGRLFGKRKIIPEISPKKTLAGAIGGILGCIFLMIVFGVIVRNYFGLSISYVALILLGLLCGTISQIGDWAASAIKRYVNVKDFGNIMPGHGGVLDRFDSILFVAPVIYYVLVLFIK
ncbi:phosphatidate cytidylyltransferase [Ruminiclostridium papyrosolvens DSM 2782]|uniref:Phosphatidate cytidylyltransferase n=1 Tax=Ruminiclostridium papyrosolvens DSM 2782 TaxID=588581 RepID=F1TG40_9FIRM|nr:phosphatidate cytidylyltransferase [Ruminiclostridium papyrosolvens]EGD46659.1 phosphatidate cytidylyltransferase [Ruminiclostridium papyrosolvens DSM 2782]WES35810.1 phosphatidate cytidylyltransferase [Ruminiclostridium papyrosolvens DSM 2782]